MRKKIGNATTILLRAATHTSKVNFVKIYDFAQMQNLKLQDKFLILVLMKSEQWIPRPQ